jgi:hypothetical protein
MILSILFWTTLLSALTNAATPLSDFTANEFKLKHDYKRSFKFPFAKDGQVYHYASQGGMSTLCHAAHTRYINAS